MINSLILLSCSRCQSALRAMQHLGTFVQAPELLIVQYTLRTSPLQCSCWVQGFSGCETHVSVDGGESTGRVAALAGLHLAREDDVGRASHLGCLKAGERIDTALACGSPLGVHLLRQLAQPLLLLALGYRFAMEAAQAGQLSVVALTLSLCHCRAINGTSRDALYTRAGLCMPAHFSVTHNLLLPSPSHCQSTRGNPTAAALNNNSIVRDPQKHTEAVPSSHQVSIRKTWQEGWGRRTCGRAVGSALWG